MAPPHWPSSGAGPSMSLVCGSSWAPIHTPPGYKYSSPFPGRRMPCAGQGIWNGGPSPSWKWAAAEAFTWGWRSLILSPCKIHVEHRGTGWKTIAGDWWFRISPSTGPPPGQSLWSRCHPPCGSSSPSSRHTATRVLLPWRPPVWWRRPSLSYLGRGIRPASTHESTSWGVLPSCKMGLRRNVVAAAAPPWKYPPPPEYYHPLRRGPHLWE